jgi:hypothetical protein
MISIINMEAGDSRSVPAQDGSNVPDLVKIGSIPTNTAIDVETSVLDPVVFSQTRCRFVLENKGILHSNSKITLSVSNTADVAMYFPINIGAYGLIQRASLRVGTKTLCEIDDFNNFMAYESQFISNETQKEREQVQNSRIMNHGVVYTDVTLAAGNATAKTCTNSSGLSYGIDSGLDYDLYDSKNGSSANASTVVPDPQMRLHTWQKTDQKGVWQVLLSDLFPFLRQNQLPLYMMSEQVSVELTWAPIQTSASSSYRCLVPDGTPPLDAVVGDNNIVQGDCQMIADYIYYPQELMQQYQAQNQQMSFSYVDYRLAKRTVAGSDFSSNLIYNVGGAGRIVNKIIVQTADETDDDFELTTGLLNRYQSFGPIATAAATGKVTVNVRYNDNFLYPVDVDLPARHFHNMVQAEGRVPFISRDEYFGEGQIMTTRKMEGYNQQTYLGEYFFHMAHRLNRGERVNSRGIEIYDKRLTPAGGAQPQARTLRCWLQLTRMASLVNGVVSVQFA